jgi:glycerophosphoryl diester phosphodiesterase
LGVALERGGNLRQITIDFKENAPKGGHGLAEAVVKVGKTLGCEQCLYWGKSDETVREALRLGAKHVGFVVANFSAELRSRRVDQLNGRIKGAHAVAVQSEMVTPDFMRRARRKRLAVHVWTVNDETAMENTLNFGVDAIVTDEPQLLKRTLERMRRECPRGNDEV